jgi:hypothetical protein
VQSATPFFKCFGPLLFGNPPVAALKKALEKLCECNSLAQLRQLFGCYIPIALLAPKSSGHNSRQRIFSLDIVFWAFLDQVQTPMGSCRESVRKVMAYLRRKSPRTQSGAMSPDTAAYCKARARIPLDVIEEINAHLVERMQRNAPHDALWHGRHVKLVDGTGVSMPDTPENQARWPQSSSQKRGCGFPLMNLVGIFCLATGALIKAATGDRHTHETILFQSLWHTLEKGDLVVADRGYCSFGAFANLLLRGVDALMRLPEKKIRQAIASQLPNSEAFDVIVTWKRPAQRISSMTAEDFALLPESIPVRVVRYTIAHPGFRTQSVTLVTTLLEAKIKAADLALLYCRRWGIELHFREIKILLNMDVLRCLTPDLIERELQMHFVAYNLIRCIMQRAALTHHADINRLSFKGCLDTVRQFANALHGAEDKPRTVAAMVDEMLLAIARDPNPKRPNRSEPRAVKRRRKNFHLLTKPRHQMGNLPHRNKGIEKHPESGLS